jgi:3-oxoacyl-[acyl-carrier protein] reductase
MTDAAIEASIPLGRFGTPSEMCATAGFLASGEAAYVTGVVLPVDGGLSM